MTKAKDNGKAVRNKRSAAAPGRAGKRGNEAGNGGADRNSGEPGAQPGAEAADASRVANVGAVVAKPRVRKTSRETAVAEVQQRALDSEQAPAGDASGDDGEDAGGEQELVGFGHLTPANQMAMAMVSQAKQAMDVAEAVYTKNGRKTKRTPERIAIILRRLSSGHFLTHICREERLIDPEFPADETVELWARNDAELFMAVARAREAGATAYLHQALEIADSGFTDYVVTPFGIRFDASSVARSKLQVDTRIRMAEKLAPRLFGPRLELAPPVEPGHQVPLESLSEAELMKRYIAQNKK